MACPQVSMNLYGFIEWNLYGIISKLPLFDLAVGRCQLTNTPLPARDTAPYSYLAYTHRQVVAASCYVEMHEAYM